MKYRKCLLVGILYTLISLFLYAGAAGAAPREVTLFPASAQVVEATKLKVIADGNLKKATFTLPAQAQPETLVTRLQTPSRMRIMDQTWREIVRVDDEKIKSLKNSIETLKNERNQLQATVSALETQIQFWQMQTKAKVKTPADAGQFSAAIGKNIKMAYQDKLSKTPVLEKLNLRIKDLEEELNQTAGKQEKIWEVTLMLSGAGKENEIPVTYAYNLSGCGWSPLYRLEAKPQESRILFTWEADIWQSSGQDWNQTAMKLATMQPATAIAPHELPPWIIKPRPVFRFQKAMKKNAGAESMSALRETAADAEDMLPMAAAAPAPVEVRHTSYSVWELGRVTLPAGARQRVKVQEEPWAAEFMHLLRPSLSGKAFIRASLAFPEGREIPSGQAILMLDGAILGKRPFAFAGKEGHLFFGEDPLVASKVDLLSKQSGEKAFLADKQTYKWEWRTEIENRRSAAIKLRVEESLPQSRDERIKMTLKNDPEPSESSTAAWIWNLDAPAGKKLFISTTVSVEAPKDMNIDLGWRK